MFECTFDANPVMYEGIRWVRQEKESDEEVIVSGSSRRISVDWDDISGNTVKSRLIIRNVTVQDAGKIACIFSNGYGIEARGETYLLVKRKNNKSFMSLFGGHALICIHLIFILELNFSSFQTNPSWMNPRH